MIDLKKVKNKLKRLEQQLPKHSEFFRVLTERKQMEENWTIADRYLMGLIGDLLEASSPEHAPSIMRDCNTVWRFLKEQGLRS